MHRLHRVVFPVVGSYEASSGVKYWYGERCVLAEVTPAALEELRLGLERDVRHRGGAVLAPRVLWHSHFRRRKGRISHPRPRPRQHSRRQKERARERRELMLRDKRRMFD